MPLPANQPTGDYAGHLVELRNVTEGVPGWNSAWESVRELTPDCSATLVAALRDLHLILLELAPDTPYPDFNGRLALYRACCARSPSPIVVLMDASDTRRTWMWSRAVDSWLKSYRESPGPRTREAAVELLELAIRERAAQAAAPPDPADQIAAVLDPLLPRKNGRRSAQSSGSTTFDMVRAEIECARQPGETARVWRLLQRLVVFDPDCGDGGWLLAAMLRVETLYAACLQRMAGWIADFRHLPGSLARRREMERIVALAGGEPTASISSPIRTMITMQNLHGVAACTLEARVTRLRLTLAAGARAGSGEMPGIEHRIITLVAPPAAAASPPPPSAGATLFTEARIHQRAFEIVRELHVGGRGGYDELVLAYGALKSRKLELARRANNSEDPGAPRLPELLIHFPALGLRNSPVVRRHE